MQRGNQGAWAAESSFFEVAEDDAIEVQATPAVPPAPVAGLHDFKLHHHHDPEKASPAGSVTRGDGYAAREPRGVGRRIKLLRGRGR
jgi:hypothetical protein